MTDDPLRRSALLAALPDETLAWIRSTGREETLAPGEVLIAEGAEPDAFYIVLDGELDVVTGGEHEPIPLAYCGPGDVVGELALVHRRPRSATVRAATSARVLRLEAEALEELLAQPKVAMALLDTVARRLEDLELQTRQRDRMTTLGTLTAGLLHELNNPAAAVARSVDRLRRLMTEEDGGDEIDDELSSRLSDLFETAKPPPTVLDRLRRERELAEVAAEVGVDEGEQLAALLAQSGLDPQDVRSLTLGLDDGLRTAAWRWLARRGRRDRLLEEAVAAAGRISEIVGAVKRYSHVDEAPVQDVDLHDGLEAALVLLRGRIPSGVEVVRDYDPALPHIEGYPGDLNSVWTNLIDNALDAVGPEGTITLRTRAGDRGVAVQVENTGPEIPPEVLARVFDPFFTTKPIGRGTGLGLATSYTTVTRRHRGNLTLESEPGRTVATVELPSSTAGEATADRP